MTKSMVTGRRVQGATRRPHRDDWPRFEADASSDRVVAARDRDRLIVATHLAVRGGMDDIAAMLDLPEVNR